MVKETDSQELEKLKNMVLQRKKAYQRLNKETLKKYQNMSILDRFKEFLALWSYNSLSNKDNVSERQEDLLSHKYLSACLAKLRSFNE